MRTALLVATTALYGGLLFSAQDPAIRRLDRSSITPNQIDQTVLRLMSAAEVAGAGISIFNNGRVVYSKAYGFRDLPKKAPLTENSVFTGASLSKAAFAYMVMQLVDAK
ncbi:MAG: serine hydrolase, partial [Bryobacteraceae bacterium]